MKKFLAILLALAMVFSFAACGEKKEEPKDNPQQQQPAPVKFIMGIDPEYDPFSYLGPDGNYTGFDVEVCRAACELLGYEMEIFGVNWDEKLIQLDAKECDCVWSGMTIRQSMKDAGYVISNPYFNNDQIIVVKENSGIKSSADLAGKIVGVQLGTSGEAMLTDPEEEGNRVDLAATFKNLVTANSFATCFADLDGNAVDAVIVDMPVAQSYVAEHPGFVILDEVLGSEVYGIAFRNGEEALCEAIEGAVADLVKNGTYQQIADKYDTIDQLNLTYVNRLLTK